MSSVVQSVVELRGRSPNFIGLCPFHTEKTPSFHVRDQMGRFKCFGCGASGDVFEFLMRLRGITFSEAKTELALKAGLSLSSLAIKKNNLDNNPDGTLKAQSFAQEFFINRSATDPQGQSARSYLLKERGLSDAMIRQAGIGFGGSKKESFFSYLKQQGINENCAQKAGLLKAGGASLEPHFGLRITFPIKDIEGRIIAFGGRSFENDHQPKYVNTHSYVHYEKRHHLYGLFESKAAVLKGQTPVLVEGYFDAMAFWALGIPAIALCGTSLTSHHIALLSRLGSRIIFCFDADNAGYLALKNAVVLANQGNLTTSAISLKKAKDPGDYLASGSIEELKKEVALAQDTTALLIDQAAKKIEGNVNARIHQLDELLPVFASIKRPILRRQYVYYLATTWHEDSGLLWSEIEKLIKSLKQKSKNNAPLPSPEVSLTHQEKLLLQVLLAAPKLKDQVLVLFPMLRAELLEIIAIICRNLLEEPRIKAHRQIMEQISTSQKSMETIIQQILLEPIFNTEEEAEDALVALNKKIERQKLQRLLQKKREEVQEFAKAKDFSAVIKGIKEQSDLLMSSKGTQTFKKRESSLTPPSTSLPKGLPSASLVNVKKVKDINRLAGDALFDGEDDWLS